jgi:hypothetical protein
MISFLHSKKILRSSMPMMLIGVVFIFTCALISPVHAATPPVTPTTVLNSSNTGSLLFPNNPLAAGAASAGAALVSGKNPFQAALGGATNAATGNPAGSSSGNWFTDNALGALGWIMFGLMTVVGWLLALVGEVFNWVIVITVFQYANYFGNSQGMLIAWGILRDIGNIVLLFGFIFMGICTILDIQSYSAKKALPSLLIFAVLLNFSLFAGEVVVDGTNLLGAGLFQQAGQSLTSNCAINSTSGQVTEQASTNNTSCAQVGIAGAIIQDSKLGSILDPTTPPTDPGKALLAYTATTIFMAIVMIVLLAGAIMFFTRAIMLTLLLIISPIGFAGMAIPPLQGMAKEWWQRLISNAIFAPVFLLLIFISLKVMSGVQTSLPGASGTLADALVKPSTSIGSIFILYGLVVGFMIAALMFARSSGAAGASFATNFAQKTVLAPARGARRLGGMAGGVAARETAGRVGAGASKAYTKFMGGLQTSDQGWKRGIANTARFVGADAGIQGALSGVGNAKFGTKQGFTDRKKATDARTHELESAAAKDHNQKELQRAIAMSVGTPADIRARDLAITEAFGKMSKEEKAQTPYIKAAAEGINDLARNMSQKEYDDLLGDDHVSHATKDAMKAQRFNAENAPRVVELMGTTVSTLPPSVSTQEHVLSAMKANQLASLDPSTMDEESRKRFLAFIKKELAASNPEATKFTVLIGSPAPGSSGKANNNATNRWNGYYTP